MARVTRRPLAAADILDIWDHIAEDSLDQADRWIAIDGDQVSGGAGEGRVCAEGEGGTVELLHQCQPERDPYQNV